MAVPAWFATHDFKIFRLRLFPPPPTADQYRICTYFTCELIHALISGCLSFYLTYYVVSLLSGFITAIFIIDT